MVSAKILKKPVIKRTVNSLFDIDLRSLVAFRIAAGLLALYDALIKFPHIRWLYSTDGYRDFSAEIFSRSLWIHQLIANLSLQQWQILIGIQAIAGILLVIGWRPKVWLVVWLIILRLTMRRNDLAAHIGDLVFTFFCYWILFLPLQFNIKEKFLKQTQMLTFSWKTPWSLPYFVQLFCLYFFAGFTKLEHGSWQQGLFFVRNIQSEGVFESYGFLAQFPWLLQGISYALPVFQILVSLLLFVPWKKQWIRGGIFVFWGIFHLVGYLLVSDATMYWFLMVPLIVLIPKEFWNALGRWRHASFSEQEKTITTELKSIGRNFYVKVKTALVFLACVVIVSSNYLSLYHDENPKMQKYFELLSRTFLYQFWFVFADFAPQHNNYSFYVKVYKDDTELILLPRVDRAESFIAGRFHVMKRAIYNPHEMERWVAALCLDHGERYKEKSSEKDKVEIYSIIVKRHIRKFSDVPPLKPTITYADEKEYICHDLITRRMGRYN